MINAFSTFFKTAFCILAILFNGMILGAAEGKWTFSIDQSNSSRFNISVDQGLPSLGYIAAQGDSYEYYDSSEKLNSQVRVQWQGWNSTAAIVDVYGKAVGTLKGQNYIFYPTYQLLLPEGSLAANISFNLWQDQAQITDAESAALIATATRPHDFTFANWTLEINNMELFQQKAIDLRVLFFLLAIQSPS